MDSDFDLWLEFEHIVGGLDDYCNVFVTLADGRRFAFNVWTYAFFGDAVREGNEQAATALRQAYLLPPDLFVRELTRPLIEDVVADLIRLDSLPAHCEDLSDL